MSRCGEQMRDWAQRPTTPPGMRTTTSPSSQDRYLADVAATLAYQAGVAARSRLAAGASSRPLRVAVRAGDAALAEFLQRHRGLFVTRARSRGVGPHDLDDALQLIAIHVARALLTWRPGGASPLNWVMRYVPRVLDDAVRSLRLIRTPRRHRGYEMTALDNDSDGDLLLEVDRSFEQIELRADLRVLADERPCACVVPVSLERPWCCRRTRTWLRRQWTERAEVSGQ